MSRGDLDRYIAEVAVVGEGTGVPAPPRSWGELLQSLEPRGRTQYKHPRGVAVHTEGVRDPHRHHGHRARHEFEPLLAGLHRQASLQHDVTLVLRMRVKRRRCVARKEEFDQRETPVARFAGAPSLPGSPGTRVAHPSPSLTKLLLTWSPSRA